MKLKKLLNLVPSSLIFSTVACGTIAPDEGAVGEQSEALSSTDLGPNGRVRVWFQGKAGFQLATPVAMAACQPNGGFEVWVVDSGGGIWKSDPRFSQQPWVKAGTFPGATSIACGDNLSADSAKRRVYVKTATSIYVSEKSAADGTWTIWSSVASGTQRISNDGEGTIVALNTDSSIYQMKTDRSGWLFSHNQPGVTAVALKQWIDSVTHITNRRWFYVFGGEIHFTEWGTNTATTTRIPWGDVSGNPIIDIGHPGYGPNTDLWWITKLGLIGVAHVTENPTKSCNSGSDDDGDGQADSADYDCGAAVLCSNTVGITQNLPNKSGTFCLNRQSGHVENTLVTCHAKLVNGVGPGYAGDAVVLTDNGPCIRVGSGGADHL